MSDFEQNEWSSLDALARANLSGHNFQAFLKYRDTLQAEGHVWLGDADEMLRGYIWDASEEQD